LLKLKKYTENDRINMVTILNGASNTVPEHSNARDQVFRNVRKLIKNKKSFFFSRSSTFMFIPPRNSNLNFK